MRAAGEGESLQIPEDILAPAKAEGYELSNEELEAVSGGDGWVERCNGNECPYNAPMR